MNIPNNIKISVFGIYIMTAISALILLINKQLGIISSMEFIGMLFSHSLFLIIPYKIGEGSNIARHIFIIMTIFSYFLLFGGVYHSNEFKLSQLDIIYMYCMIPINIFIIYLLTTKESNTFFKNKKGH